MYRNTSSIVLFILIGIILIGCVQQQKSFDTTADNKLQSDETKLVYRVGQVGKFVDGVYTTEACDESINIIEGKTAASKKLLDNCKISIGIVGWIDDNTLLGIGSQNKFQELNVKTGQLQPLAINIPITHIDHYTGATAKSPKLIAQLVKNEPKLLEEIIKHNWRLVDLQLADKSITFIILSLEQDSSGFQIYSFNRENGKLIREFIFQKDSGVDKIYFLNEREIIFSQIDKEPPYGVNFIVANVDGSNQRKGSDKLQGMSFIGDGFIGFGNHISEDPQYKVSIFDIEKNTIREIPLEIPKRNSDGYTVDLAFMDFSKSSNMLAYKTEAGYSALDCNLYVLDLKTEKNTKLADKCFINDVWWSK